LIGNPISIRSGGDAQRLSFSGGFFAACAILAAGDVLKHAALLLAGPLQPWPDSESYWRLGTDVARGDWWQVHSRIAFRTPLYPWILGICQRTCGPYALLAIVLLQHLLELTTSFLTAATVGNVTKSRGAFLAAYALCVFLTARCLFANAILTETGAVFLTTLLLWFFSVPEFPRGWRGLVAASVCLGVAVLQRPAAAAYAPALLFVAATMVPPDASWMHCVRRALVALVIVAAVATPWCARNALVWNRFSVSVFLGRELWAANFSPWPGAHLVVPEDGPGRKLRDLLRQETVDLQHNWSVASALARQGMNDAALDDLMKDVALLAMRRNPGQVVLHFCARCLTFWYVKDWELSEADYPSQAPWRDQVSWSNARGREWLRRFLRLTPERFFWPMWLWSALTWLGVVCLVGHRPSREFGATLAALLLGLTLLTAALEIPCYRYRCVLEPAMVVAVVAGLSLLRRSSSSDFPSPSRTQAAGNGV
jgi:hypothetical protein